MCILKFKKPKRRHAGGRPKKERPKGFYKQILAEFNEGGKIDDIAEKYGVSRSTINNWLRNARNGISE